MHSINRNDIDGECEICFDRKPVYIPLISCTHSNNFCEKCMKNWFAEGHCTCPKCRICFPIQAYLKNTNQTHIDMAHVSLTRNSYVLSNNQTIQQERSNATDRIQSDILACCAIGLLVGLIIYPTINQT